MVAKKSAPASGVKPDSDAASKKVTPPLEHTHKSMITDVMAHHHTWWWRMFVIAEVWRFFIPWPLPWLAYPVRKQDFEQNARWTQSSAWLTIAILVGAFFAFGVPVDPSRDLRIAAEAARVLFTGAFLIGTILSVSVALPGQAVIKTVITKRPRAAIDFIVPFAWAFMWGILGATMSTFYPNLGHLWAPLQKVAIFVALYGAMMELSVIGHTVRMYTIGLLLWGMDETKKKAEEAKKKAEDGERKADDAARLRLLEEAVLAIADGMNEERRLRVHSHKDQWSTEEVDTAADAETEAEAEAEAAQEDTDVRRLSRPSRPPGRGPSGAR